ncbi:hypothetical protein F2Q69_00058103 [Brassica cretica]|uniref:Uncharacterized protein n=1 Tax=Brassica cretica TaxID=69181 RepID=A0A8S9RGS4_BRACR|nr:hypothetical protein F2Q69_00058103 [Brassica cretica]
MESVSDNSVILILQSVVSVAELHLGRRGFLPLAALPFSLTEVVTVEDVCLVAEDAMGFI